MSDHHEIRWITAGRTPTQPPNPAYPNGKDIDTASPFYWKQKCKIDLPYDDGIKRGICGLWHVTCHKCGLTTAITMAARPDDPRSIVLPCQRRAP